MPFDPNEEVETENLTFDIYFLHLQNPMWVAKMTKSHLVKDPAVSANGDCCREDQVNGSHAKEIT